MRDPETTAKPAVRRIVVLRPNHRIGNTLLLTPLMQQLEAQFPAACVELVTAGGVARAVFARYPQVTALHAFPAKSYQHPGKVLQLLTRLRGEPFDLAIDPTIRSRAGRFLLRWVRARRRLGYAWGVPAKDVVLTDAVDPALAPVHHAQIPLYLLQASGLESPAPPAPDAARALLDIRLSEAERREGVRQLAAVGHDAQVGSGPTLGVFAHATGAKCLPAEWWRELIGCLKERAPSIRMVEFVPEDARSRLEDMMPAIYTPQLRMLGAKLAATSLVVIADGGIMHLAEASGAAVLGLFTTTSPAQYAPQGRGSESLQVAHLAAETVASHISARLLPAA
jgi:heptosyltransferase-3